MATPERVTCSTLVETAGDVEIGGSVPIEKHDDMPTSLVIATYNIRYAVGPFLITGSIGRRLGLSNPGRRPALVARHLERAALSLTNDKHLPSPQLLAMQEVDRNTRRAGRHDIASELAGKLQMSYAFAASDLNSGADPKPKQWYLDFEEHLFAADGGRTGMAILSRLPFTRIERLDLPWTESPFRPRLALAATLRLGEQQFHVINLHIDPHAEIEGQLCQQEAVLARAAALSGPIIILGDFNTLSKRSGRAMRALLESNGFTTPFRSGTHTWRAGLIRLQTDWIFVRGARVKRQGVVRRLRISDHWPVWAEIEFGDKAGDEA